METVTIVRPGTPSGAYDSQQNPVFSADVSISSDGWLVAPRSTSETAEPFGQQTITGLTLYNRTHVDVYATDKFTVRGQTWTVDGDTAVWVHPDGLEKGVVVNLSRGA